MPDPAPPPPVSVTVPTIPWYRSRILWAGTIVFLTSIASGWQSIAAGGKVTWGTIVSLILGALVAGVRAAAPDVITGIAALDKQP